MSRGSWLKALALAVGLTGFAGCRSAKAQDWTDYLHWPYVPPQVPATGSSTTRSTTSSTSTPASSGSCPRSRGRTTATSTAASAPSAPPPARLARAEQEEVLPGLSLRPRRLLIAERRLPNSAVGRPPRRPCAWRRPRPAAPADRPVARRRRGSTVRSAQAPGDLDNRPRPPAGPGRARPIRPWCGPGRCRPARRRGREARRAERAGVGPVRDARDLGRRRPSPAPTAVADRLEPAPRPPLGRERRHLDPGRQELDRRRASPSRSAKEVRDLAEAVAGRPRRGSPGGRPRPRTSRARR